MKSALTLIAALALTLSVSACSKEEKKNEAPAATPVAAAPTENSAAPAVVEDMATKMAEKMAAEMGAQAMKAAEAAGDTAVAAGETAEAAGETAAAAGATAEAAGATAEVAVAVGAKGAVDGAAATKALTEIAEAAQKTGGDCAKVIATLGPVVAKHQGTLKAFGESMDDTAKQQWAMANLPLMQKLQTAVMPLAACAMKDPKIAEMFKGMN